MRLRTRLLLAFGIAIVVPMAAVGGLTARSVIARFSREYEERLEAIRGGVQAEWAAQDEQVRARLAIAAASEPVQRLLVSQNLGQNQRGVAEGAYLATELSRSIGLPLIKVLGEDGRILASGHWPASFGYPDPEGLALALGAGGAGGEDGARLSLERVGTDWTVSLEGAQWATLGAAKLAIVGGIPLDQSFLEGMRRRLGASRVELKASRTDGSNAMRIIAEDPGGSDPRRLRTRILALPLGHGVEATLTVGLSTASLESLIGDIRESFAWITLSGLALALAAALFFARSLTRPIESLVEGVRGVARGVRSGAIQLKVAGELGELIEAFNGMIRDLRATEEKLVQSERVAAWQEIARRLAHEIKNSLFPIQLSIQTIRKVYQRGGEGFAETFDESTKTILEEVGSLKELVEEFSRFARLPKPFPEPTALPEVFSGVVALLVRPRADVKLVEDVDPTLPLVQCDREQIKRVLLNVIGNALEAMPGGGELEVRIERAGGREGEGAQEVPERGEGRQRPEGIDEGLVEIRIRDSGVGISGEDMKKIFIPYFTTKAKGTGLGLAIVQRIVSEHGGTVRIESEPGKGTAVTIRLPVGSPASETISSGHGVPGSPTVT